MSDPEVCVSICDTEFSIGGLRAFIDRVYSIDGMPADALVEITHDDGNPTFYTLRASTEFRKPA